MRRSILFLILVSLSFSSLARAAINSPCTPAFPLETGKPAGWQGADAAYSVPLPNGRDIWIFGDTLYGPERQVSGNIPKMVHNSLGISTCKNGHWHLDYVIKRGGDRKPVSYFSPADHKHWYWALDGFYANGDLWVTLLCLRSPAKPAVAAMNFETCGADLAQVRGLNGDPQDWRVTVHPLVPAGVKAYPSATTVVYNGYAYLFALYENGARPLLVTRIPLDKLSEPQTNLEHLAADGSWKHGLDPIRAKQVMKKGSPELSIRYHPELKEWLAVMVDPSWFSGKILLRTAPTLTGPWSDGQVVYRMPEMQPGPKRDKNIFCYAGKEHPEFEGSSDLIFTYVCNTLNVPDLITHPEIYWPQVVRQPMPRVTSR